MVAEFRQRCGRDRDVCVDEFQGIGLHERRPAGEDLVNGCTQRVEIRPVVDHTIHASGLLRRDIGQGAGDPGRGFFVLVSALHKGRESEIDDAYVQFPAFVDGIRVRLEHDDVGRVDVPVDDALVVDRLDCPRDAQGDLDTRFEVQVVSSEIRAQRDAAFVFERDPAFGLVECQCLTDIGACQALIDLEFALIAGCGGGCAGCGFEGLDDDVTPVAFARG